MRCVLPLLVAASLLAPAAFAGDGTVGLCTLKEKIADALGDTDADIVKLTSAAGEKEKRKLGEAIAKRHGRNARIECLIRYREPDMRWVFVPLLSDSKWPIRARALYGLKMTGDASVVPDVVRCLSDKEPKIRELAANTLCRVATGVPDELRAAREKEKDRFVRASMEAAIGVLESGATPYDPWDETLVGPDGAKRVEWAWTVKGAPSFNRYDGRTLDYPVADSFDWPISWYDGSLFAPVPRKSFGAGGTHAGEDMAWFREGCSLYAVANGLVRMVQGAGGDWGFLVAVEHHLPDGSYVMAIYGHCGWDLLVKPGDVVTKGQRIATCGMSCAVENGGYGAHLHFGISEGPFRRPAGLTRGSTVDVEVGGKTVAAPVLRLGYDPERKDQYGFPGLAAIARLPDGTERPCPVPAPDMARQVGWMQGYVKDCAGWFDPRGFIGARRQAD